MDYEQKYKEALEKAKSFNKRWQCVGATNSELALKELKEIFPELVESEDEKIRKELICFLETEIPQCNARDKYIAWLEKQGNQKPVISYDALREGITHFGITQYQIDDWLKKYVNVEKQGEQKARYSTIVETGNGGINALVTRELSTADKVEPKFKVRYAGGEYNVLEVKDIAGVTFYGIEDEPNHIDYVKADNCEIISGYGIKENGYPYPTKPSMFSEQKQKWSDEDEKMYKIALSCIATIENISNGKNRHADVKDWLKSLKERTTWKPSERERKCNHSNNES